MVANNLPTAQMVLDIWRLLEKASSGEKMKDSSSSLETLTWVSDLVTPPTPSASDPVFTKTVVKCGVDKHVKISVWGLGDSGSLSAWWCGRDGRPQLQPGVGGRAP